MGTAPARHAWTTSTTIEGSDASTRRHARRLDPASSAQSSATRCTSRRFAARSTGRSAGNRRRSTRNKDGRAPGEACGRDVRPARRRRARALPWNVPPPQANISRQWLQRWQEQKEGSIQALSGKARGDAEAVLKKNGRVDTGRKISTAIVERSTPFSADVSSCSVCLAMSSGGRACHPRREPAGGGSRQKQVKRERNRARPFSKWWVRGAGGAGRTPRTWRVRPGQTWPEESIGPERTPCRHLDLEAGTRFHKGSPSPL